jgi:predicted acylesterase/phospholipase RssA
MKYLAVGPGSMGFFILLGAISKLKQSGELADLEEISGSSAGGLLALLFLLAKGDTVKILDYSLTVQIKSIMKPSIRTFLKSYGLVSVHKVRKVFSEALREFTGKDDLTFKELFELNPIKLHLNSFCVDLMKTVYFSVDTSPDMSVLDAVCATCAMPFLFEPVKLKDGWRYADGATAETCPGGPFLSRQADTLALVFGSQQMPEIKDLKSYALSMLWLPLNLRHVYGFRTCEFSITGDEAFDFGASNDAKLKMFLTGFSQTIVK